MLVARTRREVRDWSRWAHEAGERVALVPTMGALHPGHDSLVDIAREAADRVALSIFVNPLQFGPGEDFERYPRDLERDLDAASAAGIDLVFAPSRDEVYPGGEPWIRIVPERGADTLCGRNRPAHFSGVLTVVAKLFGVVSPDVAVFGEKDYQQLVLIRRMVEDLELGVEVRAAPIVREADGLAMSSRNRYLSAEERERSLALSRALRDCAALFTAGERDPAPYRHRLHRLASDGLSLEYGEVVDPVTLAPVERVVDGIVCAVAARVGATRLIDNHILGTDQAP
ncbi:MAG: pantoate--beta-alanine ligase [Gemmatimonadota bacterium]